MVNDESGCALQVADQVHIHLPSSAFTNEALNFWFGALMGVVLLFAVLASKEDN